MATCSREASAKDAAAIGGRPARTAIDTCGEPRQSSGQPEHKATKKATPGEPTDCLRTTVGQLSTVGIGDLGDSGAASRQRNEVRQECAPRTFVMREPPRGA